MENKIRFEDKMILLVLFLLTVLLVVGLGSATWKTISKDNEERAAIALNEARCKELALIYGDSVKVTDGFYKGQEGTVVDRTGYSDGTAMKINLKGGTGTVISVKCKDLAR